jgi:hypothetical protein
MKGTPRFFLNGIDARTGEYFFTPLAAEEILTGMRQEPGSREKALVPGIDPKSLSETGWGVIFHEKESPEIREALKPLLEHRRAQAGERFDHLYREFWGDTSYHVGENKEDFLSRRGANLGPVRPNRMPYYLLLVGSPSVIPYSFQHQLDVQYAVGRICFDSPEEYANYARSVVAAETGGVQRDRKAALFGVRNSDDEATQLSADLLVRPLADALGSPLDWQERTGWKVESALADFATKSRLGRMLGGDETPALLFTASHGLGFSCGDPLQRDHQGSLLCQDWPGPKQWQGYVPPDHYFSADDVGSDANVAGLVAFHFACHGAGVPAVDNFGVRNGQPPRTLAPEPFVSRLPQRLLSHPKGGALAVIGHVERAWAYSFLSKTSTSQLEAFDSTLRLLMDGYPVGFAMEYFNQLYGELAADLITALQRSGYGEKIDPQEIEGLWTAANDARNYAVVGDPAVRVAVK